MHDLMETDRLRRCFSLEPVPVPPGLRGRWLLVSTRHLRRSDRIAAFLQPLADGGDPAGDKVPLRPIGRADRWNAILFADRAVFSLRLTVLGCVAANERDYHLSIRPITSLGAATRLFGHDRRALRRLFGEIASAGIGGLRQRIRSIEADLVSPGEQARTHAGWLSVFETWSEDELPDRPSDPTIGFLVFHGEPESAALRATLSSIQTQMRAAPFRLVGPGTDWKHQADALRLPRDGYVGVLGAGEVLPPHAVAVARAQLRIHGKPPIAIADEDRTDENGVRSDPTFRPQPNHALMMSATLSRGLWLMRTDVLSALTQAEPDDCWAEAFRLRRWLERREAGLDGGVRLAHVLSSRRSDTETAPSELLTGIVARHLRRNGLPFRAVQGFPIRLAPLRRDDLPPVTAIVPSTLTAPHAERCIASLLRGTDYNALNVIVASSAPVLTPDAETVARRLEDAFPKLRVVHLLAPEFNFARTINQAAELATGDLILLLNDDVSPIKPDWLARMAGWLLDGRVGAVGARLLYPDNTIQHAGIVLGLAGLCEHAHRHAPADEPGHASRAQLPQSFLAVTGACLLVPASVMREVGGMDEAYPSAFNDVDLCLRIGETGRDIVLSDATLTHEELQTYGSHFAGRRAAFEADEVARMRGRWARVIADDPFYNPNLDLRMEHAWRAAWPPRQPPTSPITPGR